MWSVRDPDSGFDPNIEYANDPNGFTLEFHHGGELTDFQGITYQRGKITYVDKVDRVIFSMLIFKNMVISLGYEEDDLDALRFHFKLQGEDLDFGLRSLASDSDALSMLKCVKTNKVIDVYIEHIGSNTQVGDVTQDAASNLGELTQVSGDDQVLNVNEEDDEGSYEGSDEGEEDQVDEDSDDPDFIEDEDNLDDNVDVDMDEFRAVVDFDLSDEGEENANLEDEIDDELDLDDFDSLSDSDHKTTIDRVVRGIRKKKKKAKQSEDCPFYVGQSFGDRDVIKEMVTNHAVQSRRQLFISKNDTERFRVVCHGINLSLSTHNKDGGTQKKGKSINPTKDKSVNPTKEVGISSSVNKSKDVGTQKKHQNPSCPWALHISNVKKEGTWTVKTCIKEHLCLQTRDVNLCTVSWIAKEIEPIIQLNPEIPPRALVELIQKKHQVQVTVNQMNRAKTKATEKVQGDYCAQYETLRDYCEELIRSNPGTTVKLEVETECNPSSPTRQFKRVYICLGALKAGFKLAGRDLLGLDGCFLKGPFPGQILTAVGLDANNGIYPVAYAVVEAENTSSWTWFLEYLGDDLDLHSNSNFTFISDRQKGILPAIAKVYPSAEHRFCLRHIHENMKPRWRGQVFKNLLWAAASATTPVKHEKAMKAILKEDKALHDWLKEIPAKHWSRALFSVRPRSDVLLNNLCEVFNRQLVQGRDKPIITCLEFIREYLMKRIVVVHKMIAKAQGPLTPKAAILFEKIKTEAANYSVIWCGNSKYQVSGPELEQRAVNLGERSCGCRRWELTGIPCRHATACIWNMAIHGMGDGVPEHWVDEAYWLETWKKVYAHTIEPVNGKDMWAPSQCPTTLRAPKYHKQVGRPKKKRKKSVVELEEVSQAIETSGKMARKGNTVTCQRCKGKGHNRRSCTANMGTQGGVDAQGGVADSQAGN